MSKDVEIMVAISEATVLELKEVADYILKGWRDRSCESAPTPSECNDFAVALAEYAEAWLGENTEPSESEVDE